MMKIVDYSEIDFEELASGIGIGAKHIPLLLGSFVEESTQMMEELFTVVKEKDYEKIATLSHSIKGSASNLQLKELAQIAKEMELSAKAHESEYNYEETLTTLQKSIKSFRV